jgi:hypothetical protein
MLASQLSVTRCHQLGWDTTLTCSDTPCAESWFCKEAACPTSSGNCMWKEQCTGKHCLHACFHLAGMAAIAPPRIPPHIPSHPLPAAQLTAERHWKQVVPADCTGSVKEASQSLAAAPTWAHVRKASRSRRSQTQTVLRADSKPVGLLSKLCSSTPTSCMLAPACFKPRQWLNKQALRARYAIREAHLPSHSYVLVFLATHLVRLNPLLVASMCCPGLSDAARTQKGKRTRTPSHSHPGQGTSLPGHRAHLGALIPALHAEVRSTRASVSLCHVGIERPKELPLRWHRLGRSTSPLKHGADKH